MVLAAVLDPDPLMVAPELTLEEAIQRLQTRQKTYLVVQNRVLTEGACLSLLVGDPGNLARPLGELELPASAPGYRLIWAGERLKGVLILNLPEAIWTDPRRALAWIDLEGSLWHSNPTWQAWLGGRWQQLLGDIPWGSLVEPWCREHLLVTEDGRSRYVFSQISPVAGGCAVEILDRSRDKEQELIRAAIVQAIPDLMVKIDRQGRRKFFMPGQSITIYKPELAFDSEKTIYEVLPAELAKQRMDYINLALATQTTQVYEHMIEINGKRYFEESRVTPCNADEVLILVRDITDKKIAELRQQWQYERLRLINAITQSIRQSLNLETILNTTVREVRILLNTDRVIIYQFDQHLVGTITAESVSDSKFSLLGETIVDPCFQVKSHERYRQGYITSIADIDNSSIRECYHRLLHQYGVKANLVVPIILEANSLWGLLIVHHCTGPYDWDPWMVELLTDLAQQLGIAIQHAQLHQRLELANSALQYQVNIRNAELQSLLDYEKLLRTITEAVRANLNEESILKEAVEAMIEGLDVKDCLVGLLADSNQTTYRIGYAHNPNCLGLIDNLDPLVYEHLLKHQSIYFSTHHLCLGQVTLLIAPMYDQDSLIGFLELIREPGDEFSAAEIRLAEQIANQCAIGIRQARLYQDSLQQVRKLEEINRLKDEFVHMVSHELRTPLTNMNMALKMIEARGVQESQQRYFQILRAEWARELNLVNELLELQALESGTRALVLTSIPVAEVIYKIVEPFIFRTQEHQQYFLVEMQGLQDSMAEWVTDLSLFERIVIELLNNACKYTPSGEKIILRLRQAPEQLIITVINTGVEIPADRQGKIFDKFFRLPNLDHWNQGGTGLGLPLVRKAVELLGGSIKLTSRQRQTQFEVYLPPCQVDQLG